MKILRLSLSNLASIAEPQHIHFEHAPLAHAGLIAITGKTGAGKSTLLDAMCLALYDRIPRLTGAAGSIKDIAGNDLSIKDPKQILRRGCTSGFAELEFIALDGQRYQARWEVWRAHKKADGNLKYNRAITCLDDQRLLNHKVSEATPLIEKLIGLSFEQFTRAVLLAQSEVGAFLKAKDHERADLLEYLTNSQIFSEVSKKSAEKYSQIKQQRSELENVMGHLSLLSEQELLELKQQQHALDLQLKNLHQSEKILDNERKWYLEHDQLYAEVQGKKEVYSVQLDALKQSAAQQQLLQQLDDFQAIRAQFVQRARLQPLQHATLKQHAEFMQSFAALQLEVEQQQAALQQQLDRQQQFEQHCLAVKPQLERGLQLDHDIKTVSDQYKKLSAEQQQLRQSQLEPLQTSLNQQQSELDAWQNKQQQLDLALSKSQFLACFDQEPQSVVNALQRYAQQYHLLEQQAAQILAQPLAVLQQQQQDLSQQLQSYTAQYPSLEHLSQSLSNTQKHKQGQQTAVLQLQHQQQQLEQLLASEQEADTLQHSIQVQQAELVKLEYSITKLSSEHYEQETAYSQLQYILEQQRQLHSNHVQQLRAQLKPNEACLVCGSHQHPFIEDHSALEKGLLQLHEQQRQHAQQALQQLHVQLQQQQIEQSKLHTLVQQQQLRLQHIASQRAEQLHNILHNLQQLGYEFPEAQVQAVQAFITAQINHLQQHIQALTSQEDQQYQLLEEWRSALNQQQQLELNIQRRLQLEQGIQTIVCMLPERYQQQMPIAWLDDVQQQLKQRIAQLHSQKQLATAFNQAQQQLEKMNLQYQSAEQREQALGLEITQLIEQGKQLRQQLAALTEQYAGQCYRLASEWQQALDSQAQQQRQQLEQQRLLTTQAEQNLHAAHLKQQSFISQLQQIENELAQVQSAISAWQASHPSASPEHIETWLAIDLAQHQQIRHSLHHQQQLLENAKTAWQVLEERYHAHLQQQPEHTLAELEQQLAQLVVQKSQQQETLNELDAKLRIHANNQRTYQQYHSQIEQIKAEEYRWGRIYELIGHREGTKFQKIAQEHHLDILVEYANQQLQPLAPRYQLHRIADSLSLAIIDLDMNSEIRPVLSLSGGESFLVSLALALAIANMAAGSMKLESLFIDEGFGSLDPASLHMVMNALDHLQSQGRKVVLISHVQEMHERIPVQIQVKAVGGGASQIKIVS